MKIKNILIVIVIAGASIMSCGTQQSFIKEHQQALDERANKMELLYSKIGVSDRQKETLRMLDEKIGEEYMQDLSEIGNKPTLLKKRKDEMKLETDRVFLKVLEEDQVDIYSIYTQNQNQSIFSIAPKRSKYLITTR